VALILASFAGVRAAAAVPSPAPAPSAATAAANSGKATFGIGAADAKGLDGRPYLNYTTSPGARTNDHVVIRNYGRRPISVLLYAADATASSDGSIGFAPRAEPGSDASRWITFGAGARTMTVRLAPAQSHVVPISVVVPANASPGDHLVGVMASYFGRVVGKSGQQIKFEQRVALRAMFRVSGEIRTLLTIDNLTVHYHGTLNPFGTGSATVTYTVHNAGNVLLAGTQRVSVTGIFGSTGSTSQLVRLPLMLAGASFPMRVEVRHVWPQLLMHAKVSVAPLGVAGSVDTGLHAASASATFWAIPWTLLALVVAAVGLMVGAILWRRRLNARPAAHSADRRKAKPALGEA
jgi:hypothetical protein